jgi:hypothetical protein
MGTRVVRVGGTEREEQKRELAAAGPAITTV